MVMYILRDPLTHTPGWEEHERDQLEAERDALLRRREIVGAMFDVLMAQTRRRALTAFEADRLDRLAENHDALSDQIADLDRELDELPDAA
jgi:hypothetical protein